MEGARIPGAHYASAEFARLEKENLWTRVWQMACREDEIPERGDFIVYELLDQEFLVVRVDADTVNVNRRGKLTPILGISASKNDPLSVRL
jgi:phenylpropionate dioxygenase-like ring-hydroxylating dioxygenase large terminal subunit